MGKDTSLPKEKKPNKTHTHKDNKQVCKALGKEEKRTGEIKKGEG